MDNVEIKHSLSQMHEIFAKDGKDLSRKISEMQKVKSKVNSYRHTLTRPPTLGEPHTTDVFHRLGAKLNVPGKQAELLVMAILDNPSDDELEVLGEMLMIAKLKHPEVLDQFNSMQQICVDKYNRDVERFETAQREFDDAAEKLKGFDLQGALGEIRKIWVNLMESLRDYLVAHDGFTEGLDGDAYKLLWVIDRNSKYLSLVASRDRPNVAKVEADWDHIVNNLKSEHIRTILQHWSTD